MNYYLGPYQWVDDSWNPPASTVGAIDLRNLTHMGTPTIQNGVGFFATTNTLGAEYDLLGQGDLRDINSSGAMKSAWNSILGYTPSGDKLVDLLYDHLTIGADPIGATACKPLMPARGKLNIHLGGHSVVKSTQFRFGHSPESNKVISVLQEDYREIRNLTQGGGIPANHHRKVLDFWGEQYGIKDPQLLFIPNDLPVELPIPHSTSISENFDGADNAAVGKQLTWVEGGDGSHWDNFNNHARKLGTNTGEDERASYANSALSGADQRCTMTTAVQTASGNTQGGPACRRSNSVVTFYVYLLFGTAAVRIQKVITGTRTGVGSATSITLSIPDTLKLEVIGSDLEGFFNGVSKSIETDTAITGNLFCGFHGIRGVSDDIEFDDWSAQDIVAGGAADASSLLMGLL